MTYLDMGIGPCAACGTERRRYIAQGASLEMCLPCVRKREASRTLSLTDLRKSVDAQSERQAEWTRRKLERYAERTAAGICRDCGREPALPSSQRGAECHAKHKAREAARRAS